MTAPIVNEAVIALWTQGRPAKNHKGTLTTDGKELWSYALSIGDTCKETGVKIVRRYQAGTSYGYRSQTTSCHVGLAVRTDLRGTGVTLIVDE